MLPLVLLKLLSSLLLTSASIFGALLPFFYLLRPPAPTQAPRRTRTALSSSFSRPLSVANCVAAGMLLAMALTHFLPHALTAPSASPPLVCGAVLLGLLLPAVLERGIGEESRGVAHETAWNTRATALLLPMGLHSVLEGALVGVEASPAALLASVVPLTAHRVLDGFVIGVSIAKGWQSHSPDPSTPTNHHSSSYGYNSNGHVTPGGGGVATVVVSNEAECAAMEVMPLTIGAEVSMEWAMVWRRLWRPAVGMWLAATPLAATATAFGFAVSTPVGVTDGTSAVGGKTESVGHHSPRTGEGNGEMWLVVIQAMGSGSFLFVGLTLLLGEELRGWRVGAAVLFGVAFTILLDVVGGE